MTHTRTHARAAYNDAEGDLMTYPPVYPQLQLEGHSLSSNLADMVTGTFALDDDHDHRVLQLATLIKFYNMVMELGWLEHTSDWDWRITVLMDDGTVHGTFDMPDDPDYDRSRWADTIRLDYDLASLVPNFEAVTHLTLEQLAHDREDQWDVLIPIADIATITFGD